MRPIRLTIEGLRSFRAPVTLDFTGRDHLAIVGDTGAGKSSILEAITYALYGQTTFAAQANQELMNDTSMHLRVVLRFRVSGETWEVARTLRRGGQGRVGPAGAQLRRVGADDQAVEQVEQVKPVNERIKALLGLDSEAFLRTVVLPQGRFARLLVEDKPTDRGRILRQVWRTDELEAAGELAGAARQEAEKLRVRLEQAASDHPEDPAAHLARLQAAHEAARRHEAAASEDERAASAAREAVLAADKARQAAAAAIESLRDPESGRAADTLAPLADIDRRIAEQDAALERRQAETAEALSRIPADDGPTGEEAAAALTTLESLGALATAAEEGAAALRAAGAAALDKHAEARRLTATAADAQQRAAGHAAQRAPLDEAAATARERRDTVAQQHARCAERAAEGRRGPPAARHARGRRSRPRAALRVRAAGGTRRGPRGGRRRRPPGRGAAVGIGGRRCPRPSRRRRLSDLPTRSARQLGSPRWGGTARRRADREGGPTRPRAKPSTRSPRSTPSARESGGKPPTPRCGSAKPTPGSRTHAGNWRGTSSSPRTPRSPHRKPCSPPWTRHAPRQPASSPGTIALPRNCETTRPGRTPRTAWPARPPPRPTRWATSHAGTPPRPCGASRPPSA